MATVSGFESMTLPGRNELKQFTELFEPVFRASSIEARRNAVAALTRCPVIPNAVAWFIASQPISVAAIFLTASQAISDDMLIAIARTQGADHARAIAARDNLSVKVVDALVALHDGHEMKKNADQPDTQADTTGLREEALRQTLKNLVQRETIAREEETPEAQEVVRDGLLVRFARLRQAHEFAYTLSDCLQSSRWLANRIMLDISGRQLGTALVALGLEAADGQFILSRFYPHLLETAEGSSCLAKLWSELDADDCAERVRVWMRADALTEGREAPEEAEAANRNAPSPKETILFGQNKTFGRMRGHSRLR